MRKKLTPLPEPTALTQALHTHCLQVAITAPEVMVCIPVLRSLLTDNPLSPGKVGHTTVVYVPYSFRTLVWILCRPTRTR